jgi:low temperature requirement protein LtrA
VACTYVGVGLQHWLPGRGRRVDAAHAEVAGGHLVERFRLLFIIVLGETVLTMGTAFTDEPFALDRLIALSIGFAGTVALWWCYFHRTEPLGAEQFEAPEEAGTRGLSATWALTLAVLALIGIAVADQLAIGHPREDTYLGFTVLAFGGPALFLLSQIVYHRAAFRSVPRSRALGLAALAILAALTAPLTLIAGIAASSAVLVAVAWADTMDYTMRRPSEKATTPNVVW